jgi:twitching motility protein PilU
MILDKLFQVMADRQASDIFICAGAPIHIKIQGNTVPVNQQIMDSAMIEKIAAELMNPEQANSLRGDEGDEPLVRRPQARQFPHQPVPQRASISIVVRYILGNIPALDSLLLPPVLADLVMERRGLILIVGSTGSGKSTTIASMLDHRNSNCSGHILTIEDPIEYLFKHKKSLVNQREIGMDTLGWDNALKNAMRQAPDCILIGEIRDQETMQAAIAYAQTGHLCLGTLHANNSYHALNRVINFFPLDSRGSAVHGPLGQPEGDRFATPGEEKGRQADAGRRSPAEQLSRAGTDRERRRPGPQGSDGTEPRTRIADLRAGSLPPLPRNVITLQEALLNADSPTNLSWLINNHEAPPAPRRDGKADDIGLDLRRPTPAALRTRSSPSASTTLTAVAAEPAQMSKDSSRSSRTGDACTRSSGRATDRLSLGHPRRRRLPAIIAGRLEAIGFACEFIKRGGVSNLWARRGDSRPLLCFAGHTDVVPSGPLEQWHSDPFQPTTRTACCMDAAPPT